MNKCIFLVWLIYPALASIATFHQGKQRDTQLFEGSDHVVFFGDSILRGVWLHTIQFLFQQTHLSTSEFGKCWGSAKLSASVLCDNVPSQITVEYNDLRLEYLHKNSAYTWCHDSHIASLPFYGKNLSDFLQSYHYENNQILVFKLASNSADRLRYLKDQVLFLLRFIPARWKGKLVFTTNPDFNGLLSKKGRTPEQQAERESFYKNLSLIDKRIFFMSLYPLTSKHRAPDGQHFHIFCKEKVCGRVTKEISMYLSSHLKHSCEELQPPKRMYCTACPPTLVPFSIQNRTNFECSTALPPPKKHDVVKFVSCPCLNTTPTDRIQTQSGKVYVRMCI